MMTQKYTMTATESAQWESDTSRGLEFRTSLVKKLKTLCGTRRIEIYHPNKTLLGVVKAR